MDKTDETQLTGGGECYLHTHPKEPLDENSDLQLQSARRVLTVTSSLTLTKQHTIVLADTTGGTITITFPAAAISKEYTIIKKVGANSLILNPTATEVLAGATSVTLTTAYDNKRYKAVAGLGYVPF